MIIGNQNNLRFLENALKNSNLGHALCFVGPDQIGKRTIAKYLSSIVLKTEPDKLASHADFHYIKREVDEKKDRLKKDISIAQAKSVNSFLANRSWFGGKKVVIIDEAETMNIEAANALLKSLEESVENSLFFLLTVNDDFLPITIKSRCQIVNFSLLPHNELISGLISRGYDSEKIDEVIKFAWGRPGRAIEMLEDEEKFNNEINEISRIRSLINAPFYKKLKEIEDIFGDKNDAVRGRDRISSIINTWTMVWRDYLRDEKNINRHFAFEVIEEFSRAQQLIKQNIHPRLLIEKIILKI